MESVYDKIVSVYPELKDDVAIFRDGTISLRNDGDSFGDYIEIWNYSKPLTKELQKFLRK